MGWITLAILVGCGRNINVSSVGDGNQEKTVLLETGSPKTGSIENGLHGNGNRHHSHSNTDRKTFSSDDKSSGTLVSAPVQNSLPPLTQGGKWPRLLGEYFDGVAVDTPKSIDLSEPPRVRWQIPVGDGYGLGAIENESYFHFDAIRDPKGSRGDVLERLRAFSWLDGTQQWESTSAIKYSDMYGYEAGPRTTPTVDQGKIFTFGVSGQLICRRATDGKKLWSKDTTTTFRVVQNFFGAGGSPLIVDDLVVVMVGGSPLEDQQIAPGQLNQVSPAGSAMVAFDKNTGEQKWAVGDDLASYSSPRTLQSGDQTYVLLFARDHLLVVDPNAGTVVDKFQHRAEILESVNAMVPVVNGNEIFISECYEKGSVLLRFENRKLSVVWQDKQNTRGKSMRCHWSTPILVDGYLYGASGRNAGDSDVRCVRWSDGKVMWTALDRNRCSVSQIRDHLVVWTERGDAHIAPISSEGFEPIARWSVGDLRKIGSDEASTNLRYPCWAAPVMIGKDMFLRGNKTVACLHFSNQQ